MDMPLKMDLHMHSTVSDGTDTPAELKERVREAGIALFALTDHDAVKGCGTVREALPTTAPFSRAVPTHSSASSSTVS